MLQILISSIKTISLAYKPWYISCSNILPKFNMKILNILVSCGIIVVNVISIVTHYLTKESNKVFCLTVIAINLNDVIYGIYLACIWAADLILKDTSVVKEEVWRSGPVCFIAFGSFTLVQNINSTCSDLPFIFKAHGCNLPN